MKITILSVGKQHDNNLRLAIEEFTKRVQNYYAIDWQIISPPKNAGVMSVEDLKKAEGVLVVNHLFKEDYLILLDERGKNITSPELATIIEQRGVESVKRIVFLIGGAFGVDEIIFKRANFVWSLSKLVFPHMIVRLIVAEQVYRACSINRNEKYHHI